MTPITPELALNRNIENYSKLGCRKALIRLRRLNLNEWNLVRQRLVTHRATATQHSVTLLTFKPNGSRVIWKWPCFFYYSLLKPSLHLPIVYFFFNGSWYCFYKSEVLEVSIAIWSRAVLWTAEEPGLVGWEQYNKTHFEELSNFTFVMESDEGTFTPLGIEYATGAEGGCIIQEIVK